MSEVITKKTQCSVLPDFLSKRILLAAFLFGQQVVEIQIGAFSVCHSGILMQPFNIIKFSVFCYPNYNSNYPCQRFLFATCFPFPFLHFYCSFLCVGFVCLFVSPVSPWIRFLSCIFLIPQLPQTLKLCLTVYVVWQSY